MKTTARTALWLKDCGIPQDFCERKRGPRTVDLFGLVDQIALVGEWAGYPGAEVWWIQSCASGELNAHIEKARQSPYLEPLCERGRFLIFAWRKLKGKGRRQWWPRIYEMTTRSLALQLPASRKSGGSWWGEDTGLTEWGREWTFDEVQNMLGGGE